MRSGTAVDGSISARPIDSGEKGERQLPMTPVHRPAERSSHWRCARCRLTGGQPPNKPDSTRFGLAILACVLVESQISSDEVKGDN